MAIPKLKQEIAMSRAAQWMTSLLILVGSGTTASADAITDWNEKATALVTKHRMLPPQAERIMACMHVAMFDAVNSLDRRYQPYGVSISAPKDASKETAAVAAAGAVLEQLFPSDRDELRSTLSTYLASIPEGSAKSAGMKVGEEVGAKTVLNRQGDGADAPDAYRPKTKAGVYVPTPITASSMWPRVK